MKRIYSFTLALLCGIGTLFVLPSCGGSGGGSGSGAVGNKAVGLAPAALTGDIILTPTDANVHGVITLSNTPARVAYFNSTAGTAGAFTGNYTYTKVGPNMAELTMDNLRAMPINSANDSHWTIVAHLTFVDNKKVILSGTETLVGSNDPNENDPLTFDGGGTRNFSYNYEFEMAGH